MRFGQEIEVDALLERVGARRRPGKQTRFTHCAPELPEFIGKRIAMGPTRRFPITAAPFGLKLPLEKLEDHDPPVAPYASLVCLAHILDLLGNVLSIDLREPAFTEEGATLAVHSKKSRS